MVKCVGLTKFAQNFTCPYRKWRESPAPSYPVVEEELGHWTQPGGTIYGVIISGIQKTQAILGDRNLLEDFKGRAALRLAS
jgi:hypothetical protein